MLTVVLMRKREQEFELETVKFEQDLFINNTPLYREYIKNKEEQAQSGNEGITWMAPESIEEARELMGIFSDIDKQLKEMEDDSTTPEQPAMSFLDVLGSINVDEIGGED